MTEYRSPNFPALFIDSQLELRQFDRDLINALGDWDFNLRGILQGGLSLTDNVDVDIVSFTSSATPDAENTVSHGLGKVPAGFIVVNLNKGAVVYDSGTAWTESSIYLKCNTASTIVKIIVF